VQAVFTAADLGELNRPSPLVVPHPELTHGRTQRPLAVDKVCFAGEAVALVVADSRYLAEDALDAIRVEWEPLPAVVDFTIAQEAGRPLVHADVPKNVAARVVQVVGDPDGAFARAAHVVVERLRVERSCGSPTEARGVVAVFDPRQGTLRVWARAGRSRSRRCWPRRSRMRWGRSGCGSGRCRCRRRGCASC
jgi:CO/xanthine dehydrogenase Mo-binding subunit